MNRVKSHLDQIHMIGQLADLKDLVYKQSLLISALSDLLIEKKLITREEIACMASRLDEELTID
ncbi:hypothetical protein [Marinicrinis lubricantis]|uniref:Uncharacterized protein n=1 Tax=Marinicrinis lubricantis TaxID=2086470 RepID=A0ABW1IQM6_9BACL